MPSALLFPSPLLLRFFVLRLLLQSSFAFVVMCRYAAPTSSNPNTGKEDILLDVRLCARAWVLPAKARRLDAEQKGVGVGVGVGAGAGAGGDCLLFVYPHAKGNIYYMHTSIHYIVSN